MRETDRGPSDSASPKSRLRRMPTGNVVARDAIVAHDKSQTLNHPHVRCAAKRTRGGHCLFHGNFIPLEEAVACRRYLVCYDKKLPAGPGKAGCATVTYRASQAAAELAIHVAGRSFV